MRGSLLRLRGPLLIIGSIAENKNRLSLSGWEGVEKFSCLNMIRRKTLNVKEVGLLWYSLTGQKEPAVHTALATVLDFQEEEVEKGNLIESLITEFFCGLLYSYIELCYEICIYCDIQKCLDHATSLILGSSSIRVIVFMSTVLYNIFN